VPSSHSWVTTSPSKFNHDNWTPEWIHHHSKWLHHPYNDW
jgi:hypothetical protein